MGTAPCDNHHMKTYTTYGLKVFLSNGRTLPRFSYRFEESARQEAKRWIENAERNSLTSLFVESPEGRWLVAWHKEMGFAPGFEGDK